MAKGGVTIRKGPSFSANLGYLWTDRSLPDAVRAAYEAGFDAVECHAPYDTDPDQLWKALSETGLPLLSINTRLGDPAAREFGLAAVAERKDAARASIVEAFEYAARVDAQAVHVLAGNAAGATARRTFIDNLRFASDLATEAGRTVLIEPLNATDAPRYFLRTTDQAAAVVEAVGRKEVRLMFDCYHVGQTEGDVLCRLEAMRPILGHVQFASVPDRGPPDHGEIDYPDIFAALLASGWTRPLGAEYRPGPDTDASLGWLATVRGHAQ